MKLKCLIIILIVSSCGLHSIENPFADASQTAKILSAGNISTNEFHESVNYISPDNKIFYTRSDKKFTSSTLYSSEFIKGEWTKPKILPFSGTHYDAGIHFSPNQREAFFTSKRNPNNPDLSPEWNIWRVAVDRDNNWGQPEVLPPPINSTAQECCLTMNKSGNTFFASNRAGSWDIYQAMFVNGQFSNVKKLNTNVNSENGEWPGFINARGDMLLISSIRENGYGGDDIYIVHKVNETWSNPILLDSTINSSSYEDSPLTTANGEYFLFSSWKENEFSKGVSNIYYSNSKPETLQTTQNK